MITAVIICALYVLLLIGLVKLFGVKYTDFIKSTENIKKGIIYPIGIGTVLLVAFAYMFDWLPDVFTFTPKVDEPVLWLIPAATLITTFARFYKANLRAFDRKGIILLILGSLIIGFSEELLVRGIAVSALQDAGYSVLLTGIISSLIFGVLHFMNYFNGQNLKKTSIQVAGTVLMGLNFYIIFVISGTLWLPIIAHALYDLSIFLLGPDPKIPDSFAAKVISISTLAMFILPIAALIYLR